jgi:hypothetical protein
VAHSWPKISASSDALIKPGNSGGSFLNQSGEVVGVIVSKLNALLGSVTRDMIECRRGLLEAAVAIGTFGLRRAEARGS